MLKFFKKPTYSKKLNNISLNNTYFSSLYKNIPSVNAVFSRANKLSKTALPYFGFIALLSTVSAQGSVVILEREVNTCPNLKSALLTGGLILTYTTFLDLYKGQYQLDIEDYLKREESSIEDFQIKTYFECIPEFGERSETVFKKSLLGILNNQDSDACAIRLKNLMGEVKLPEEASALLLLILETTEDTGVFFRVLELVKVLIGTGEDHPTSAVTKITDGKMVAYLQKANAIIEDRVALENKESIYIQAEAMAIFSMRHTNPESLESGLSLFNALLKKNIGYASAEKAVEQAFKTNDLSVIEKALTLLEKIVKKNKNYVFAENAIKQAIDQATNTSDDVAAQKALRNLVIEKAFSVLKVLAGNDGTKPTAVELAKSLLKNTDTYVSELARHLLTAPA